MIYYLIVYFKGGNRCSYHLNSMKSVTNKIMKLVDEFEVTSYSLHCRF